MIGYVGILFLSTGIIGRITPNCELGWEVGGKGGTGDDPGDLEPIQVLDLIPRACCFPRVECHDRSVGYGKDPIHVFLSVV